jgi:hypothetical protein
VGGAVDGGAALVHGLEQRALGARRGAVDLVGEQHVREDGPAVEAEGAVAGVEHLGAEDVAGQQVGGELHPGAGDVEAAREGPREGGLADAGDVLDEHVAAREHADDQQQLDGLRAAGEHRGEAPRGSRPPAA